MRAAMRWASVGVATACALTGCGSGSPATATTSAAALAGGAPVRYGYSVVHTYPHDPTAFTEGLVAADGLLYESTGTFGGPSTLRRVDLATGRVLARVELPPPYFGEGLTMVGDRLIQLTWRSRIGLVYDRRTLARTGDFAYQGEGWGLTDDGGRLIMSNGSDELRFLDRRDFSLRRTLHVTEGGRPVTGLNELEYVRGEVYANVFGSDDILRIDPGSGAVVGRADLRGLLPPNPEPNAVLNGIAYDATAGRLLVTGKLSPELYEIRLIRG